MRMFDLSMTGRKPGCMANSTDHGGFWLFALCSLRDAFEKD